MAENSSIEWTDHTFNPWIGCTKVGPGCDLCYAEERDKRFHGGVHWGAGAPRIRTSKASWAKPLMWSHQAFADFGRPARVFCASLADWADKEVDPAWRADMWGLVRETPNLEWLMLSKRGPNIEQYLPADWGWGYPNVRLGHTFCNQEELDRDMARFLAIPARGHFCSLEPLLGPMDLTTICTGHYFLDALEGFRYHDRDDGQPAASESCRKLTWVIVGGESGRAARPMHPDWAKSIRNQCRRAGTPFLFKQWGEWAPYGELFNRENAADTELWAKVNSLRFHQGRTHNFGPITMCKVGKHIGGRQLDSLEHSEFPKLIAEEVRA